MTASTPGSVAWDRFRLGFAALAASAFTPIANACDLKVIDAWIREMPPGIPVLAGYAQLQNTGLGVLHVKDIRSPEFESATAHESRTEHGMVMMRPINIEIAPGASVVLIPGGKHLMLGSPRRPLRSGEVVAIAITDTRGCVTTAGFTVRSAP